jgi:uncharacterized protein YacL
MFSMGNVTTKEVLNSLITNTFVTAIIFAVLALGLSFFIANLIKWQGKPDRSYIKRRVWWIIIGIIVPTIFWCINAIYVTSFIQGTSSKARFGRANVQDTLIILVGYFVVSLISMLILRSKKWGSILGPSKNKNK